MKLIRNQKPLIAAAAAALLGGASPAQANTFSIDFNGVVNQNSFASWGRGQPIGTPLNIDLELTTAGDASNFEMITGVTGTIMGKTVTSFQNGPGATFKFDDATDVGHFGGYGLYVYVNDPGNASLWRMTDTYVWQVSMFDNMGYVSSPATNIWSVQDITVPAVPEPGSIAMMVAGLGLLGLQARRRTRPAAAATPQADAIAA